MFSKISNILILFKFLMLVMQLPIDTLFIAISKCSFFMASSKSIPALFTCSSKIDIYGYAFLPYFFNLYDRYSINGYFISVCFVSLSLYSDSLVNCNSSLFFCSTSLSIIFSTLYFWS